MGILNITPDSFSGDGLMAGGDFVAAAVEQAQSMHRDGAAVLDVGGESSRPGFEPVDAEEEIRRTRPVIAALRQALPEVPTAIDTVKASVADAALNAGASIINDISALGHDPEMAEVARAHKAFVVLMDNRAQTGSVAHDARIGPEYRVDKGAALTDDVIVRLQERAAYAEAKGIAREKIILDPGIGFGKTTAQHLDLFRNLARVCALAYPVLIGPSRKSFIGRILDVPVEERLEGTAALVALSAFAGVDIIRVHDVKFMSRVARMAAAVRDPRFRLG